MKIDGWECVVSADGATRGASHPDGGTIVSIGGRIIASCDCPKSVLRWVLRPLLRDTWYAAAHNAVVAQGTGLPNPCPFDGEPPNKDNEPS